MKSDKAIFKAECEELVHKVELADVRLVCTSAEVRAELLEDSEEFLLKISSPEHTMAYDAGVLYCGIRFQLAMVNSRDEAVVDIKAEYAVFYRLPDGYTIPSDEVGLWFASQNGVYNVWPFLRELSHSLVSRMGLPPPTLPVFRLPLKPGNYTDRIGGNHP